MNHHFSIQSRSSLAGGAFKNARSCAISSFRKKDLQFLDKGLDGVVTATAPLLPPTTRAWINCELYMPEISIMVSGPAGTDTAPVGLSQLLNHASILARRARFMIRFEAMPGQAQTLACYPIAQHARSRGLGVVVCDYHHLGADAQASAIENAIRDLGLQDVITLDGFKPQLRDDAAEQHQSLSLPGQFGQSSPEVSLSRCGDVALRDCVRSIVNRLSDRIRNVTLVLDIPFNRYEEACAVLNPLGLWWEFWTGGVLAEDCRTYKDLLRVGATDGPVWAPLVHACIEHKDQSVDEFCLAAIASDDGVRLQFSGTGGDGAAWKAKLEDATGAEFTLETEQETPIWIDL